ncbi:MAG TPA: glycosyltransferase [Polyangia bacterium]|nr:glycosyltransferase [Polyangia bacterium]
MSKTVVVIPCYQEQMRLDASAIDVLCAHDISVLLVDDGSSDGTLALLRRIEARAPDKISVLPLSPNRGKAEAVRLGMVEALARGAAQVGFADADMATPASEVVRLVRTLEQSPALAAVMGSRIARAGAHIERKHSRHYLGRLFATLASMVLAHSFYDTQCGAKIFRASTALSDALASAFSSRWAFDVELIGRLLTGADPLPFEAFFELPLLAWHDVGGSKLNPMAKLRTLYELGQIARTLAARRARARQDR